MIYKLAGYKYYRMFECQNHPLLFPRSNGVPWTSGGDWVDSEFAVN